MTMKATLREFIQKIAEQIPEGDWQYSKTRDVFKRTGLQDFIKSLDDTKRRELRDILTHHLFTGLTAPTSYVEMGDDEEAKKALDDAKERYEWLVDSLVGN